MVFGNLGDDSGTGVAFTRDPSTGEKVPYGDYLANAQGEDVVAGIRNTLRIAELEQLDPPAYAELREAMDTLEGHYRDMCDIEFTIEKRQVLVPADADRQAHRVRRMGHGARHAGGGLIAADEALLRVDANRLEELFKRRGRRRGRPRRGRTDREGPERLARAPRPAGSCSAPTTRRSGPTRGERVILVRRETTPDDYHGMIASQGILTSAGGTNSHAAVVARGEGIPAVCGADAIKLDVAGEDLHGERHHGRRGRRHHDRRLHRATSTSASSPLEESDAGEGAGRRRRGPRGEDLEGVRGADGAAPTSVRRLRVRANADTPDQATNARERGAEGIGLCRTEHMFLGEERVGAVRQMIFAETDEEEQAAYDVLLPLQREDFVGIFRAMSGLPVTVRLLDPPLHEFLPNQVDLAVEVALGEARGEDVAEQKRVLQKVNELHEANPMLGLRGVRLGIVKPGLYAMQVRAICEAAARRRSRRAATRGSRS